MKKLLLLATCILCTIQSDEFTVKVTNEQGATISEIVSTLGKTNLVALGFKKGHLKSLGQSLKGIGSLNFLGFVFSNEELKAHMKTIHKSSLKWDGFLESLKPGFESDLKSNKLIEDLPGFASLTKVDPQKLLTKAQEHNWDAFVGMLVEREEKK